jgi:hypothetical protein
MIDKIENKKQIKVKSFVFKYNSKRRIIKSFFKFQLSNNVSIYLIINNKKYCTNNNNNIIKLEQGNKVNEALLL